jgi:hypothetical protein
LAQPNLLSSQEPIPNQGPLAARSLFIPSFYFFPPLQLQFFSCLRHRFFFKRAFRYISIEDT